VGLEATQISDDDDVAVVLTTLTGMGGWDSVGMGGLGSSLVGGREEVADCELDGFFLFTIYNCCAFSSLAAAAVVGSSRRRLIMFLRFVAMCFNGVDRILLLPFFFSLFFFFFFVPPFLSFCYDPNVADDVPHLFFFCLFLPPSINTPSYGKLRLNFLTQHAAVPPAPRFHLLAIQNPTSDLLILDMRRPPLAHCPFPPSTTTKKNGTPPRSLELVETS